MAYVEKKIKISYGSAIAGLTPFELKAKTKGKVEVETISLGVLMPGESVTFKGDKDAIEELLSYP